MMLFISITHTFLHNLSINLFIINLPNAKAYKVKSRIVDLNHLIRVVFVTVKSTLLIKSALYIQTRRKALVLQSYM